MIVFDNFEINGLNTIDNYPQLLGILQYIVRYVIHWLH